MTNDHTDNLPVVYIIGSFMHEGLKAKIESLGFNVESRRFRITPKSWHRLLIPRLRTLAGEGRLAAVLGYIPTPTLLLIAKKEYSEAMSELVSVLETVRTTFFIYEDNLAGVVEPIPWEVSDYEDWIPTNGESWEVADSLEHDRRRTEWLESNKETIERAEELLTKLAGGSIELIPFRKRSDVTIRVFQLLEEIQAGIFLRLYVPHGRYQSEQFEDFLTMFSRYLRDVENTEIAVDVRRSSRGSTYTFKAAADAQGIDRLREAAKRFDDFVVLAQNSPRDAELALIGAGRLPAEAGFIVAKYARSYRRLNLEIKHEFERRHLLLKQEFESDMVDGIDTRLLPVPDDNAPSGLFAVIGNNAPVTISLHGTTINSANTANISNALVGSVLYTEHDAALLQKIDEVADRVEALRLRSELDRLKDPSTPPEERRTAVSKLKSFLYSVGRYAGKKLDEIGTTVLIKYLEGQILPPQ